MRSLAKDHKKSVLEAPPRLIGSAMTTSVVEYKMHPVLQLHSMVGNKAVQGLIIQAKLKMGQPGDQYEQEADHIAEQVMMIHKLKILKKPKTLGLKSDININRKCRECKRRLRLLPLDMREDILQDKESPSHSTQVTHSFEDNITSLLDTGQTLQDSVRAFLEPLTHVVRQRPGSMLVQRAKSNQSQRSSMSLSADKPIAREISTQQPKLTCNQLIQRRILIGGLRPIEMDQSHRSAFIQKVRQRTLSEGTQSQRAYLYSQPQLTENSLNEMASDSRDFTFSDTSALMADLVDRILPLYLTGQFTPTGQEWAEVTLADGGSSYLRREVSEAFQLMRGEAIRSHHDLNLISTTRLFDAQLQIWQRKMNFRGSNFGVFEPSMPPVSDRCRDILTPADIRTQSGPIREWITSNSNHQRCWGELTDDQRAQEILKTSSAPGTSRHHWGADIDICKAGVDTGDCLIPEMWNTPTLAQLYTWLSANASRFGFHQPYTAISQNLGGYREEKWHWSYTAISQPLLNEYRRLLFPPGAFGQALGLRGFRARPFVESNYRQYVGSVAQPSLLPGARNKQRSAIPTDIEAGINSVNGSGQPLSGSLRSFFELQFDHNFSNVRLHTDLSAAKYAEALNARAFTVGRNIFFGAGQYAPENMTGRQLLAHELTHVIQQDQWSPRVQRHGVHEGLPPSQRYRHTLEHAHVSQSVWDSGYLPSASFLGVPIQNGIHRELKNRLELAEDHLRGAYAREGLSDAQIAAKIGPGYIRGRRPPGLVTGGNNISFHSFGLAIDVNWRENLYIGRSPEESQIIERATALMGGIPINVRDPSGLMLEELRYRYGRAAHQLYEYVLLRNDRRGVEDALIQSGTHPDNDRVDEILAQINRDYGNLRRRNRGWDPARTEFMDLSLELVSALCDVAGLYWGGQLSRGADLMHFDWRSGSIGPGDRI